MVRVRGKEVDRLSRKKCIQRREKERAKEQEGECLGRKQGKEKKSNGKEKGPKWGEGISDRPSGSSTELGGGVCL